MASAVKTLIHHVFEWLKLAEPLYSQINAFLIHGHKEVKGFGEIVMAEIGDLVIGAMWGILFALVLRRTRSRYHFWLGIGAGVGLWFGSLAFANLTHIISPAKTKPMSLFALLVGMLAFGLLFILFAHIWRPLRERTVDIADEE